MQVTKDTSELLVYLDNSQQKSFNSIFWSFILINFYVLINLNLLLKLIVSVAFLFSLSFASYWSDCESMFIPRLQIYSMTFMKSTIPSAVRLLYRTNSSPLIPLCSRLKKSNFSLFWNHSFAKHWTSTKIQRRISQPCLFNQSEIEMHLLKNLIYKTNKNIKGFINAETLN